MEGKEVGERGERTDCQEINQNKPRDANTRVFFVLSEYNNEDNQFMQTHL